MFLVGFEFGHSSIKVAVVLFAFGSKFFHFSFKGFDSEDSTVRGLLSSVDIGQRCGVEDRSLSVNFLDNGGGFSSSELVDGSPDIGDLVLFELVESLSVGLALKAIVHLLFTVKLNVISVLLVHHFALFLELSDDLAEVIEILHRYTGLSRTVATELITAGAVL